MLENWVEITSVVSSAIVAISSMSAAVVVVHAINAWRREYVGKLRIDRAEEVLAKFHEAKDAIIEIRSTRGVSINEASATEIVIESFKRHYELFGHVNALKNRFTALFGREAATPFDELDAVVHEILTAAVEIPPLEDLQKHHRADGDEEDQQNTLEQLRERRAVILTFRTSHLDNLLISSRRTA